VAQYSAGDEPFNLTAGTFDEDTFPDLAVVNAGDGSISILINLGDGTFDNPMNIPAGGESPRSIVSGDFDQDGDLDLAVSNQDSVIPNLALLFGNGQGDFSAPQLRSLSGTPQGINLGDFNQDGFLDLVVATAENNEVHVYDGQGNGNFKAPQSFAVGDNPQNVGVGDLNNDGLPDLVLTNADSSDISVLLNDTQVPTNTSGGGCALGLSNLAQGSEWVLFGLGTSALIFLRLKQGRRIA
jgi:hypothetical protein